MAGSARISKVASRREELRAVYRAVLKTVAKRTNLSPLGVLRYCAHLARIDAEENPQAAFVECTLSQASGYAREIVDQLGVPVLALTLAQIAADPSCIRPSVRSLMTSVWHLEELRALPVSDAFQEIALPIEIAPVLRETLPQSVREATIVDTPGSETKHLGRDVRRRLCGIRVRTRVVSNFPEVLQRLTARRTQRSGTHVFLFAPRFWREMQAECRCRQDMFEIGFSLPEASWPTISEVLGLPLMGAVFGQ